MAKTICIVTSSSFYQQALEVEQQLKTKGYKVKLSPIAYQMQKDKNFNALDYKPWYRDSKEYSHKTELVQEKLQAVIDSDALLVLNYSKKEIEGYIGGMGLMAMTVAFLNHKPIFVLNEVSDQLSFKEEVLGMEPIILDGDLGKITL